MKIQNLLLPIAILAAQPAMAGMRSDCEARVRAAVAAASMDIQGEDEALALKIEKKDLDAVIISDVKGTFLGDAERNHTIYVAKVKSAVFQGVVKVTATRGGCFLDKITLR